MEDDGMKRRAVLQSIPATVMVPAVLATGAGMPKTAAAQTVQVAAQTSSGASGNAKFPDFAQH